jgi:hypothetical protein
MLSTRPILHTHACRSSRLSTQLESSHPPIANVEKLVSNRAQRGSQPVFHDHFDAANTTGPEEDPPCQRWCLQRTRSEGFSQPHLHLPNVARSKISCLLSHDPSTTKSDALYFHNLRLVDVAKSLRSRDNTYLYVARWGRLFQIAALSDQRHACR